MNDEEKAALVERYDRIVAKYEEENARLRQQVREISQRITDGGRSFAQNVRDETLAGKWRSNLIENKWWVIGAVAVIVLVVFAMMR